MDVDRRVGQIDVTCSDPVSRWIEDVPVALLYGEGEFLLGSGFQLAHLVLLVLRQIDKPFRLLQFPQAPNGSRSCAASPPCGPPPRLRTPNCFEASSRLAPSEPFPSVDPRDDLGHVLNRTADGETVIGKNDELGPTVGDFVRNVETARRERSPSRRSCR